MSKHALKIPSKGKAYSKTSITLSELSDEDPSLLKLNSHFSRSRDQNSTAYSECAMVFNFVRSPVNTGTCLVFRFFCLFVWVFLWKPIYVTAEGCRGVNRSWADQVESVSSRGRGLINLQLPPHKQSCLIQNCHHFSSSVSDIGRQTGRCKKQCY